MAKMIINGEVYSGSTNYASAITYIKEDGTKSTVQKELDSRPVNNNLLINSNFANPVNQRGLSLYYDESNSVGWEGYTIDRWDSEGTSVTINDGSITLGNCNQYGDTSWFMQYIDIPLDYFAGKSIAVSFETDDRVFEFVDVLPSDLSNYYTSDPHYINSHSYVDIGRDWIRDLLTITFHTGPSLTLKWVKLEVSEVATPYVPRFYSEELRLCKRYYQKFYLGVSADSVNAQTVGATATISCEAMRIDKPTLDVSNVTVIHNGASTTGFTLDNAACITSQCKFYIRFKHSGHTLTIYNNISIQGLVIMDAEL